MPTTKNRVKGRHVVFKMGADSGSAPQYLAWRRLRATPKVTTENPQGADAEYVQKVVDLRDFDIEVEAFLGAANNLTTWPDIGDEVAYIDVKEGSNALLRADINNTSKWGKWRVTEIPQEFSKDSATMTMRLSCGFID